MSIRYEHEQVIRATPEHVFTMIDNLSRTAEWLPPCVSLEKVGEGPNAPGDRLRYVYHQGGKQAEMDGEIVDRVEGKRLHCLYRDTMFDVSVDLGLARAPEGTRCSHAIEITPKTWMGRMLSPLIRMGLKKQTHDAAANLKRLIESSGT